MLFIIRCDVCGKWKRETATRTLTPCACPPPRRLGRGLPPWAATVLTWVVFVAFFPWPQIGMFLDWLNRRRA